MCTQQGRRGGGGGGGKEIRALSSFLLLLLLIVFVVVCGRIHGGGGGVASLLPRPTTAVTEIGIESALQLTALTFLISVCAVNRVCVWGVGGGGRTGGIK